MKEISFQEYRHKLLCVCAATGRGERAVNGWINGDRGVPKWARSKVAKATGIDLSALEKEAAEITAARKLKLALKE